MNRVRAAVVLLLRFLRAVFVSGLQTVATILRSGGPKGAPPPVALLRVSYAPMSPKGAAVLGSLVSLTPGTTTIDIDLEQRELLLHVLDGSDQQGIVDGIRQEFEPYLQVLFAEGAGR